MNKETRDPQAHARAKADINHTLKQKVSELTKEAEQIDQQISDLELRAARENDETIVVRLLEERKALVSRKEALPFILRGVQSRALCAQAEALEGEASDIKLDLDTAEAELAAATALIPDLQRQLEKANAAVKENTRRRDELSNQHKTLANAASYARADSRCIERGEAPKFGSGRFIGL